MSYNRLLEFMEGQEMTPILTEVICVDCSADDCTDCPGHDIWSEVDNQISKAGLELMKTIAQEWCEAQE